MEEEKVLSSSLPDSSLRSSSLSQIRERPMGGGKGRLASSPVIAVISLIGVVYYITVFVLFDDLLGLSTSAGRFNACVFSWLAFMCLFSFFVAVLTDPGSVPSSFAPETEDPLKFGESLKYCDKCSIYKPPRAHHCRVCRRCVLKMDHHCAWISNCVGYANYKAFIICVFHAAMASIYSMVVFFINTLENHHNFEEVYTKIFYVLFGSLISLLSLALSTLLVWHIYLLTHNITTIEYRIAVRAMWLAKKSGQKHRHRFDLGVYRNLSMILGPNVLKWLWPTATGHLKDGTQFPISKADNGPPDSPN